MRWAGPARTPSRLIRSSGPPDLHGSARHLRNNDLKLSFSPSHPSPPRLHPDTEGAHPSRRDKDRGGGLLSDRRQRGHMEEGCVCRGGGRRVWDYRYAAHATQAIALTVEEKKTHVQARRWRDWWGGGCRKWCITARAKPCNKTPRDDTPAICWGFSLRLKRRTEKNE